MVESNSKFKSIKNNFYVQKLRFFGQNSGVHGLRYIAQDNAPVLTREV